jgi:hypothetical protein
MQPKFVPPQHSGVDRGGGALQALAAVRQQDE